MSKSWEEYFTWLDQRGLRWPAVPAAEPVSAKPSLAPLKGIQAVVWNLYGTLVRISDGQLLHAVDDDFRMQIAIEKTLEEFNMWTSMVRKPGAPWKYLEQQYRDILEEQRLSKSAARGDFPVVDSAAVWGKILSRLLKKDYSWDQSIYGSQEGLSQRIAFFYHASLQGLELAPGAIEAIRLVAERRLTQGIWSDAQSFSLPYFVYQLGKAGEEPLPEDWLDENATVLGNQLGLRKPSQSFYKTGVKQLASQGISAEKILYVTTSLREDLSQAKALGVRTALLANDRLSLRATPGELRDPELRPDRMMTHLDQISDLLSY